MRCVCGVQQLVVCLFESTTAAAQAQHAQHTDTRLRWLFLLSAAQMLDYNEGDGGAEHQADGAAAAAAAEGDGAAAEEADKAQGGDAAPAQVGMLPAVSAVGAGQFGATLSASTRITHFVLCCVLPAGRCSSSSIWWW